MLLLASLRNHLPKATSFLRDFFTITSSDKFFVDHPTALTVVPFDVTIRDGEEWALQYSTSQTAAELRASERNGMAGFLADIDTRGNLKKPKFNPILLKLKEIFYFLYI